MFTFEELAQVPVEGLMVLLNQIARESLPIALKGASEKLRSAFLAAMSERAGRILIDEVEALGPVRVKDVDAAQSDILLVAKVLLDRGEIELLDQEQAANEMLV